VGKRLSAMAQQKEFIARWLAMQMPAERRYEMENTLFHNLSLYNTTMILVRKMLTDGLISNEEYTEIEGIFAKKYSINNSVIFR
jgi:hypothetical protein